MDLVTADSKILLDTIAEMRDINQLIQLVKQIDALKVALDSMGVFREKSILYAKLEAEALLRVAELGGAGKLRGAHAATAKWLLSLSAEDREKYISMCGDGMTIDNIYAREIGDNLKLTAVLSQINSWRESVVDEVKTDGIVNIKQFSEFVRTRLPGNQNLAKDIIDGTRNDLRKVGAVGIGDSSGIYVIPCEESKPEVLKAIKLRFESISNDFESIRKIIEVSKIKASYKDFHTSFSYADSTAGYLLHIMIALSRMGLFSDDSEMYDAIERTEFKKELDLTAKNLQMSRDKFLKLEYERVYGESAQSGAFK